MVPAVTHDKNQLPPTLEYASPTSEGNVPASQIVTEFLGGITLVVLALLFGGGAVVSVVHDIRSILSWILSIVFAVMSIAFGFAGAQEIHRGISHQFRR